MIAIIWTYKVRPEHRTAFEATYGPDGDWARLFARQDGFLGAELLRGEGDDYLTIDSWQRQADFDAFLAAHRADYEALDRATEGWTVEEVRVGVWEGGSGLAETRSKREEPSGAAVNVTEGAGRISQ